VHGAGGLSSIAADAPVGASEALVIGSDGVDETMLARPNDKHDAANIMFDSAYAIGEPLASASLVGTFMLELPSFALHPQLVGITTCETLGRCDVILHRTGSSCKGGRGFCYVSAARTLECGHAISTTSYHRDAAVISTVDSVVPCPPGTPNTNGGATGTLIAANRGPIAGCMIPSDTKFLQSADVHVPQMCALPAHYLPGCLFPGAVNYDPLARESAFCRYETLGCTDPNALNYNSLATQHDAAACLMYGAPGCTLGVGMLNYNASANVLSGCVPAIDGCMDSSAANYDAHATIQLGALCVPRVVGCMNPRANSYNPIATVNARTLCVYALAVPPHPSPPPPPPPPIDANMHLIEVEVGLWGRLPDLASQLDPIRMAVNDVTVTDFGLAEVSLGLAEVSTSGRRLHVAGRQLQTGQLLTLRPLQKRHSGRQLQTGQLLTLRMARAVASEAAAQAAAATINGAGATVDSLQAALIGRGVTRAFVTNPPAARAVVMYRSISPAPPPAGPPPPTRSGGKATDDLIPIIGVSVVGAIVFSLAMCFVVYFLYRRHTKKAPPCTQRRWPCVMLPCLCLSLPCICLLYRWRYGYGTAARTKKVKVVPA
jgi:hypothetical protein